MRNVDQITYPNKLKLLFFLHYRKRTEFCLPDLSPDIKQNSVLSYFNNSNIIIWYYLFCYHYFKINGIIFLKSPSITVYVLFKSLTHSGEISVCIYRESIPTLYAPSISETESIPIIMESFAAK